jgi:hypothetical protein
MTNGWVIDKKLPVAAMLVLAAQTVSIVVWLAGMDNRIQQLERERLSFEATKIASSAIDFDQEKRLTKLETIIPTMDQRLQDIREDVKSILARINN